MTVIAAMPPHESPDRMPTAEPGSAGTDSLAEFSAPFKNTMSDVVNRLISEAGRELDAVLARAEAQKLSALQVAEAALDQQRQRHDDLTEAFANSEKQVEELRTELARERERAGTAARAFDGAEGARLRAEAACNEARIVRESMVSVYESRLKATQEDLDAARTTTVDLQRQLEAERAERARLVATIRTVQQAFASVDPVAAVADNGETRERTRGTGASASTTPADRGLTLIASTPPPAPIAAPQPLLDYLNQLFAQIETIYDEDQRSRPLTEVVDRLTANLRCARDMFAKRAEAAGVSGAALFDQQLSERLNRSTETPLMRHLAIAAHELAHADDPCRRAEAS